MVAEEEEGQQHQLSPLKEPTEAAHHQDYSWPAIRFDVPPQRAHHFHRQFRTDQKPNNFLKGVKWSPDGTCLLSSSEDNTLRVFALPDYGGDDGTNASSSDVDRDSFAANLVVTEGESVYDFCWYPYMSATDPVSCVFASTTRDHPIHVWDATTGQPIPECWQLVPTARLLQSTEKITWNSYTSYMVNKVLFSKDGNYLYTGGRKDPFIMCWDVRKTVDVVYKLYRSSEDTNQRIYFDVEPLGRHLGTGGQDGLVHIYDLQTGQWISGFQAASDTVNGFSFHPFLPMAASSSGHRRFEVPEDDDAEYHLRGDENCVSIWGFAYDSATNSTDGGDGGADLDGASGEKWQQNS
ncbi:uncharacterized protein LOC115693487 isoform X7 [Syzygium oleosum]|uniref:uncharacterized protein LOC115693487 isoform X7 n=1 Tax=Syzygium oleosum TaxID=219896 RepID=UPI0024BBE0F7|nr:uncharacterized protein LOC115693487 isoform X7 [Syzygium oleosum]